MKSKITIDTIKSKSARFQIENYTTDGRMLSKAAISAVVKAEQEAEERHAESLKDSFKKAFNQGCWTCVQNVADLVRPNDNNHILIDLIRGLGITEKEAQVLSSTDEFRREVIYDIMGWSYYWLNKGEQSYEK